MIAEAFIIAMIVSFLHSCTWEGMIFEKIKEIVPPDEAYEDEGLIKGSPIYKPLYGCPICMTPWWGTLIYWLFFHHDVMNWLLVIGTASGISVIMVVLITLREQLIEISDSLKKKKDEK